MSALQIRAMTRDELERGLGWAADEGWNPGRHDGEAFHAADAGGFLLAHTADGEPVGMVSAVCWGQRFGFLGLYIVRPAFRGRGHGLALWRAAMARFGERAVGLDGVVAQQANYRRSGFVLAWNNQRFSGSAPGRAAAPVGAAGELLPVAGPLLHEVLEADAAAFPGERRCFMRHWLEQPGHRALALRRGGRLAGFGVVRPCREGWRIGPLGADDAAAAEVLCHGLMAGLAAGTPVQIDLPLPNAEAVALARGLGFTPGFETARMFAGAAPALPLQRVFALASFELG